MQIKDDAGNGDIFLLQKLADLNIIKLNDDHSFTVNTTHANVDIKQNENNNNNSEPEEQAFVTRNKKHRSRHKKKTHSQAENASNHQGKSLEENSQASVLSNCCKIGLVTFGIAAAVIGGISISSTPTQQPK